MKNNINNLIIMIKKLEYFRFLREKAESFIEDTDEYVETFYFEEWLSGKEQIEEVEGVNEILIELADELEFIVESMEDKTKCIFKYIVKLNIDNILSHFKGYKYTEIEMAFNILIDSYMDVSNEEELIELLKIILKRGISSYE